MEFQKLKRVRTLITLDRLLILLGSNQLLNNGIFKDYSHPDNRIRQTTDIPEDGTVTDISA